MHHRYQFLGFFSLCAVLALAWADPALADEKALAFGKKLYLVKCAKCHKLYDPQRYDDEAWAKWMGKMKNKAHLDDENYRQITDYLNTIRKK